MPYNKLPIVFFCNIYYNVKKVKRSMDQERKDTRMKQYIFSLLASTLVSASAETVLNLPLKQADGLDGWTWNSKQTARFVRDPDGGEYLELRREKAEPRPVCGISRKINAAAIAGKRITLSAEIRRDIKVSQKWQGGRFELIVKRADGKSDTFGIYLEPGSFSWMNVSKSFDIPQEIVSATLHLGFRHATGTLQFRNLKLEAGDTLLDLAKHANMGYADPAANDGKGGWSDQGPGNDASKFRWKQTSFGNVPFRMTDPEKNNGKSVLSFAGQNFPNGIDSAEVDLSGGTCRANYLYLLHTLTCPDTYPPVGEIRVIGDRNSQTLKIVQGRDVENWWKPSRKINANPVAIWRNGEGNEVGLYLSKFKLNDPGRIQKVVFRKERASTATWIVVAATLSRRNIELPKSSIVTMRPDRIWKILPMPPQGGIRAGSALDLSFLNDGKPTGTYGRVIANKDGHFAFEAEPSRPIRFFSTAEGPASWRGTFHGNKPQFDSKEKIREYVRQLRLAGYNMLRIHYLDEILLTDAGEDLEFHPVYLDRFDFLVAECGKNGIYLNMDAMTSRLGYAKGRRWGWKGHPAAPGNFKQEIYFSEEVRRNWKEGVRKLFTHINPYTGKRLADDPTVALVVGFNEQEFGLLGASDYSGLLPQWKEFLRKRYRTPQALRKAWGKDAPSSFEKLHPFRSSDIRRATPMASDINRFLMELENGIFHFYKNFLREIGYPGPVSAMNMGKAFRHAASRRDFDFIAMNGYHAHPNGFTSSNGGSGVISQESSIGNAGNLIRGFASVRRYRTPYIVTEHLHVFWNKYRYEQAFVTGAYSAFQDFDGLTGFGSNITLNPYVTLSPFMLGNDPIAKTQEFLTALLFLRGDVSPGKHLVRLALNSDEILRSNAAMEGISTAQGKVILTNRFAYSCDLHTPPGKNEIVIGRSGGAGIILDAWYNSLMESKNTLFNLDRFLQELRKKGALPPGNPSSETKGIYESETGELLMDTRRNFLQIRTPRLQGICAEAGASAKLPDFEIRRMTTRGNLALASIDGRKPIREARRLLLVVATNVLNSGMKFEDPEQRFLLKLGSTPLLLETGTFDLAFTSRHAGSLKAYALAMDGKRISELPLQIRGSRVMLHLDTAAIPNGPALYFELNAN